MKGNNKAGSKQRTINRRHFLNRAGKVAVGGLSAAAALSNLNLEARPQQGTEPRVTRNDILKATQGMIQWQVYIIQTTPAKGMGPVMANLQEHLKYQTRMEQEGVYIAAGPHWLDDEQTWNGEGLIVVRAKNLAEARQIALNDPMHKSGARTFRVRPWLINEGTINIKVNFSTRTYTLS